MTNILISGKIYGFKNKYDLKEIKYTEKNKKFIDLNTIFNVLKNELSELGIKADEIDYIRYLDEELDGWILLDENEKIEINENNQIYIKLIVKLKEEKELALKQKIEKK